MKNASLTLAVLRRPPSLNYCHALISPRSSLTLRLLRRLLKSEFSVAELSQKKKTLTFSLHHEVSISTPDTESCELSVTTS